MKVRLEGCASIFSAINGYAHFLERMCFIEGIQRQPRKGDHRFVHKRVIDFGVLIGVYDTKGSSEFRK